MGLILILTGGLSQRMGRPKALLPLHQGTSTTFLQNIVNLTCGLGTQRAVVTSLPPEDLNIDLPSVVQEHPEEGQLSSLLLGWNAFGADADWVMLALVDHPYVAQNTYYALLQAVQEHPQAFLWTPSYQKRGGHPVVFSRKLLSELSQSPLAQGARPIVRAHANNRYWVEVNDPAVLWDVDTPEQYADLASRYRDLQSQKGQN